MPEWMVGERIAGLYDVVDGPWQGGMGVVHRVHHAEWGIDLAIKSPRRNLIARFGGNDNFIGEAKVWSALAMHPNVVSCYYVRTIDDVPRLFVEYVDGGSFEQRIATKQLYRGGRRDALRTILDVAIQVGHGLRHLHDSGLIHRDIKPSNILLTSTGVAKVTDLGLANTPAALRSTSSVPALSPSHCSPEQARGLALTSATDVWSFGVAVLEAFTGGVTWAGGEIARAVLASLPAEREDDLPALPRDLRAVLERCLDPVPARRILAAALIEALTTVWVETTGTTYPRTPPDAVELRASSLNNRAVSQLDLSDIARAEELLVEATSSDRQNAEATYNLGLLRWRAGRITDTDVTAMIRQCRSTTTTDADLAAMVAAIDAERGIASGGGVVGIRCATRLVGHNEQVDCLELSRDGTRCISSSHDGTIRQWSLETGACMWVLTDHQHASPRVVISPDGSRMASFCRSNSPRQTDTDLRVWSLPAGQSIARLRGHSKKVTVAAFDSTGTLLVSGDDTTIRIWNVDSGRRLHTIAPDAGSIEDLVFVDDDGHFVSCSQDPTIRIWDARTGELVRAIATACKRVSMAWLTSDRRTLVTQGLAGDLSIGNVSRWQCVVQAWDLESGTCLHTRTSIAAIFATLCGSDVASAIAIIQPGSVDICDVRTGTLQRSLGTAATGIAFGPDGKQLFGAHGGMLQVWDIETGRCRSTLDGRADQLMSFAISPSGRHAVLSGTDGCVQVWSLDHSSVPAPWRLSFPHATERILDAQARVAGLVDRMRRAPGEDVSELLLEARSIPGHERSRELLAFLDDAHRHSARGALTAAWIRAELRDSVHCAAFTSDARLLVWSNGSTAHVWDVDDDRERHVLAGHANSITDIVITRDNARVWTGSDDTTIRVWDLATGCCTHELSGHESMPYLADMTASAIRLAVARDGSRAVSASGDHTSRIWDVDAGVCSAVLTGHAGWVRRVALTSDEAHVVSTSDDGTIRVWSFATGDSELIIDAHSQLVDQLALSPGGELIVTGAGGDPVRVWNRTSGALIRVFPGDAGHFVAQLVVSPDGRYVGVVSFAAIDPSRRRTLGVWDLASGKLVYTVPDCAFAHVLPDGDHLLVRTSNDTLQVIELASGRARGEVQFIGEIVALSPDGRTAAAKDGRLWIFDWALVPKQPAAWDAAATTIVTNFAWTHGADADRRIDELVLRLAQAGFGWLQEPGVRRALPECARIAEQRSAALAAIPRVAEPQRALQRRPQRGAIARMAIGALRGIAALAVIVLASYLSAMIRRC